MVRNQIKYLLIILGLIYISIMYWAFPHVGQAYLIFSIIPLVAITWVMSLGHGLITYVLILINLFFVSLMLDIHFVNMFVNFAMIVGTTVIVLILVGVSYLNRLYSRLKSAEKNLKELSSKQEKMISNISDVIAIMDKSGVITYKSTNIKRHFGWSPEELIGKSGFYNVHPDDQSKLEKEFGLLLINEKNIVSEEFKYRCKDETYKYVQLTAKNMIQDPHINGLLLNYRDITAKKKALDRLIDNEIKYRTLFEYSVDIVCILDLKGKILDINKAGLDLFEYSREELLKMNVADFIYEEDKEKSKSYFEKLNKEGFYKLYEGRIVTKAGKIRWIQVSSSEIIIDGIKIGSQDVIRDITEEKEVLDELKDLNVTKDKFFSIISHDLRNPFISIIGFSELLMENINSKQFDNMQEFATIINETAIHSNKLLTNLLDWSNLQRGTFSNKLEPLLLHDLITEAYELHDGNALQKGINLIVNIAEDLSVFADKNMTTTILRNLISNAIKFTKAGGTIKLEAIVVENVIRISVLDTGVGISEKDLQNIFKIESSFSTKGTLQEKGTGLGLILCKEFVGKQNGEIWVESELGIGSTFSFTLPKYPPE